MVKKWIVPLVVIFLVLAVFFGQWFFPEPQILYTPESLGSDIWNKYYPAMHFLRQSLRNGELPFWSKSTGIGFPLLAEGQIGALYIPNLVSYYLFPTWLAWNLNFVIVFFLAFLGSYLLFKRVGISSVASLFSAFSFSFGGYFISRVIHYAPMQAMSLLPWIFLVGERFWNRSTLLNGLFLALVFSQQIFSGGFQWVFFSIFGYFIFAVVQFRERSGVEIIRKIAVFSLVLAFGAAIAAPQILSTYELRQLSNRKSGLSSEEIFEGLYPFKNFVTLALPYYFGNTKDASYSGEDYSELGFFWENVSYMGLLPLVLLVLALFKRKKSRVEVAFWVLGIIAFLLIPGKFSPLYFVLTLPGLNNFRISSRYFVLLTFSIAGLAGFGLDWVAEKFSRIKRIKILSVVLPWFVFLMAFVDLFLFGYNFNVLVPVKEALEAPETAKGIDPDERIYVHPERVEVWKKQFFTKGWEDPLPYVYFRNGMVENLNVIFDRSNVRATGTAISTQRLGEYYWTVAHMLEASGADYIISPVSLEGDASVELFNTVEPPREGLPTYYVYKYKDGLDRVRFVYEYKVTSSIEKTVELIEKGEFPWETSVILEIDLRRSFEKLGVAEIVVLEDRDQYMKLKTNTDKDSILVVADSFYPGWEVRINGAVGEVLPANLDQRAVVVPAGENTIEFLFVPRSFNQGLVVSIGAGVGFLLLVLGKFGLKFIKERKKEKDR